MKICPKCRQAYENNMSFCNFCGCKLVQPKGTKKNTFAVILIIFLAMAGIGYGIAEQNHIKKNQQALEDYRRHQEYQEYLSTPTLADIQINSGWTTNYSGNYVYIRGSVTNTSATKTISYYEIDAKFYDKNGNMIDSDWTNGIELGPKETKKFEIMHKRDSSVKNIRLNIKEVR